jgi:hypothetical protein
MLQGGFGAAHVPHSRLRELLAATSQTIPDQVKKPTSRPTMRWVLQCFEGIKVLHTCWRTTIISEVQQSLVGCDIMSV